MINGKIESNVDVANRMLKALKCNLQSLMEYYSKQLKGSNGLQFGINDGGYLQAWCNECKFNTVVI